MPRVIFAILLHLHCKTVYFCADVDENPSVRDRVSLQFTDDLLVKPCQWFVCIAVGWRLGLFKRGDGTGTTNPLSHLLLAHREQVRATP